VINLLLQINNERSDHSYNIKCASYLVMLDLSPISYLFFIIIIELPFLEIDTVYYDEYIANH